MDGKVTLRLGGVLSLAGLGLLAQEAQANPEAAHLELDTAVTLAPAPHPIVTPTPSAQTTEPETTDPQATELDPQPVWTPGVDDVVMAAALPDGDAIAPSNTSDISDTSELAPSSKAETEVALEATESSNSAPVLVSAEPSTAAIAASAKLPTPAVSAAESQPIATSVAANPTAPITPAPISEAKPTTTPVAAATPTDISHPAAGLSATPRGQRPAAADVAALRARSQAIAALLEDVRSAAGLEASLAASPAAAAPYRQTTQPETLPPGPQLPPLPGRISLRRSPVPTTLSNGAIAKPAQGAMTPSHSLRSPQLPVLPGKTVPRSTPQSTNLALALPTPQPAMTPATTAQADPATPRPGAIEPESVRNDLRIAPLTTTANPARTYAPAPNAGIPSAFGANWGDVFISASLAGADRLRPEADGSLSMGFGLGDSRQAVGVELAYNVLSIRDFAANGSFDVKVHREVYASDQTQVAAAVGLGNALRYGSDTATTESSLYGVVTTAHLLQPDHGFNRLPITVSLGLGGGNFAADNTDVGVIAGVGLQVHPQFSVNTAWSGVGLNVGASIVPVSRIPLSLNLLYGDIGNNTRAGSVAVISIGYGYSSAPRF